jgi:hypothetical protein
VTKKEGLATAMVKEQQLYERDEEERCNGEGICDMDAD